MSKNYFKYIFDYDTNNGYLDTATIYCCANNSTDTQVFYNEKGNIIELCGTTDYIFKLGRILTSDSFQGLNQIPITENEFDIIVNT